jgi:hypothetical protein
MGKVSTVFSDLDQKRAAAFVAMSVALEVFDPAGNHPLEPFNVTTKDEKIERALRLAGEVEATPEEAPLIKNFHTAISRLRKGQSFTRSHLVLANKLRTVGLHTPRNSRHMVMTAE